jgi:large repetitive protein
VNSTFRTAIRQTLRNGSSHSSLLDASKAPSPIGRTALSRGFALFGSFALPFFLFGLAVHAAAPVASNDTYVVDAGGTLTVRASFPDTVTALDPSLYWRFNETTNGDITPIIDRDGFGTGIDSAAGGSTGNNKSDAPALRFSNGFKGFGSTSSDINTWFAFGSAGGSPIETLITPSNAWGSDLGSISFWFKTGDIGGDTTNNADSGAHHSPRAFFAGVSVADFNVHSTPGWEVGFYTTAVLLGMVDGKVIFRISESNVPKVHFLTTNTYHDNKWHHVAASWDNAGNESALYIDGGSLGDANKSETMKSFDFDLASDFDFSGNGLRIGAGSDPGYTGYNGFMDEFSMWEHKTLTAENARDLYFSGEGGLLSNDSDADGDALTATKLTDPSAGTLTFNASGAFTYDSTGASSGPQTFTYKVNDGGSDSNVATVTIQVNGPPTGANDPGYSVGLGSVLSVNAASGVLTNDSDPNGDTLSAFLASTPADGVLTLNADGSFDYNATGTAGVKTFTYKVSDGSYEAGPYTVTITVQSANVPSYSNLHGDGVTFTGGGSAVALDSGSDSTVTDADTPVFNGGTLTLSVASGGVSGQDVLAITNVGTGPGEIGVAGSTISYEGSAIGTFTGGSSGADLVITFNTSAATLAAVQALGRVITYSAGASPTVQNRTVTYSLNDGSNAGTATVNVTVAAAAVNNAPVITSGATNSVPENQTFAADVNASDPDGNETVSYSISGGADAGKFDLNSSTGVLTFKTAPDFEANASAANNNAYSVTVMASDGEANATQSVTVNVTNVYEPSQPPHTAQSAANLEMIWVEPGTFTMGSPANEAGRGTNETEHSVILTKGFYLGKYEVTQAQYEAVMTGNSNGLSATPSNWPNNANRPVDKVSWDDVQIFLTRLNAAEQAAGRLPAGWSYVLPTESEWEYACRAGTTTIFSWGDTATSTQANFKGTNPYGGAATGPNLEQTTDVGSYGANPWGFFDMHGNVLEWTADWYVAAYPTGSVTDPTGPASGSHRVERGGAWSPPGAYLRSATRAVNATGARTTEVGFRVGFKQVSFNSAPVFTSTEVTSARADESYAYNVRANDPDGNSTLVLSAPVKPAWLTTFTDQGSGMALLSGTPVEADIGGHNVSLRVTDTNGTYADQNFTIVVTPANYAPIIKVDNIDVSSTSVTMVEDNASTFSLTGLAASDQDDSNATLVWGVDTNASNGTIAVAGTGTSPSSMTYVPDLNFSGADSFVIKVTDARGVFDTLTVNLTVSGVNDAPVITQGAGPLAVTMTEDNLSSWVAPELNATDADTVAGSLTWSVSSAASNGTATVSGTGAFPTTLTYLPDGNFSGNDSFVVQVTDGLLTDTITVNVTVVAEYSTNSDISVSQDLQLHFRFEETEGSNVYDSSPQKKEGLLNNIADADLHVSGKFGSGIRFPDGSANISLPANEVSMGSNWTISTWFTTPLNDTGVILRHSLAAAAVDDRHVTFDQAGGRQLGVYKSGNGNFQGSGFFGNTLANGWRHLVAVGSVNKTIFYVDGINVGESGLIAGTQVEVIGNTLAGSERFADKLDDFRIYSRSLSASEVSTLYGNGNGDFVAFSPVITQGAGPLAKTGNEDTTFSWTAGELNATDADTVAGSLTWSVDTNATNGTVTVSGSGSSPSTFTYAPDPDYSGSDSFVVQVSDGGVTDTITVNVTVQAVNDPPIFTSSPPATDVNESTTFTYSIQVSDVDGDTMTIAATGLPSWLAFNDSGDGTATLSGTPAWSDYGTSSVFLIATDSSGSGAVQDFVVSVIPDNYPPVITQGAELSAVIMDEDGSPIAWSPPSLIATDSDTNISRLVWTIKQQAIHGTAVVEGTGASPSTFTYAPDGNFSGQDSFVVLVYDVDDSNASAEIIVPVTVNPRDDPPVITSGATTFTAAENNASVSFGFSVFDADANTTLVYSKSGPDAGLFTLNVATGQLNFTNPPDYEIPADAGANNTYDVTVRATDTGGLYAEQSLSVTVTDVVETTTADVLSPDVWAEVNATAQAAAEAARQQIMDNPAAYGLVSLAELNATVNALILARELQLDADRNATVNALILAREKQVEAERNATLAANPGPRFLTYSGRITVDGEPFTGVGQFKFAFVNGDGSQTYWRHDGNATGGEPASGLSIDVSQGVYSIRLGDSAITGMAPLAPEVFRGRSDARLRIWFARPGGSYELLSPDQPVSAVPYAFPAP